MTEFLVGLLRTVYQARFVVVAVVIIATLLALLLVSLAAAPAA